MGLFDKVKKALGGSDAAKPAAGGARQQQQGGRGQGSGGGNRQGQGGNRQGGQGGQSGQGGSGSQGSSGNRRRGSRGGRGRGGQGGQGGQGQGGQNRGQNQQRDRNQSGTTTAQRSGGANDQRPGGQGGQGQSSGSSSSNRRRRRGGRGRGGSGANAGGSTQQGGSASGSTSRTVTRSNAAELKEQQGESGSSKSGSQRRKSSRNRSGGNRRRERTRRGSASSGSHRRVLDANERPKDPVKKQILISAADPNEIRVAIREQQKVVEVYVERKGKRSLAGNIYKGRVQNVLRGMEAAFVDIGLERNGFLYVDEITPAAADSDQIMKVSMVTEVEKPSDDVSTATDGDDAGVDSSGEQAVTGAAASPAEAMQIAAAENGETLDMDDAMAEEDREAEAAAKGVTTDAAKSKGRGRARIQNKKKIQDLLQQGQEILCQVVKDPMGTKGSRLTTQYSLAGRYLVYVPDGEGMGVSRRLEEAERDRLRDIVKQFELPWGGGLIVRTAAEGALEEDIAKDLQLLLRLHEQLMDKAAQARAPKLLYNEADLSLRIIRDLMNDEVEEVLVDDERQLQRILNYLKRTSPVLAERVRQHDGQRPIFESYGVEEAIRSTLSKRADLPSGGYLIIDKTEAFHVIDVNTGRNVGSASLEETITKTNMEAAEEVVRQLRLRDLGGIIVIDFVDMNLMKNRDMVLEHFRKELSKDRTKTYLVEISPLGLVEMTRQNVSEGVREILTSTCRSCEGRGVTVSAETHAIEVERAVVELVNGLGADVEALAIEAQTDVARVLAGNQGKQAELDRRAGKVVRVFPDPDLQANAFAVRATGALTHIEKLPEPLLRGGKHKVVIDRVDPSNESDGLAMVEGVLVTVIGAGSFVGEEKTILIAASAGGRAFATLVKPARRRRRRGGRGRRKAVVGAAGASADAVDGDDGDEGIDDEDDGELEEGDVEEVDELDSPEPDHSDEIDDERTEIPQRLVMLDDDDDVDDGDDEDEDVDDDDDDEDDDASEDDGDDSDDPDDDGPSDDSQSSSDDESAPSGDEDSSLDMTSLASEDEGETPALARRTDIDDRDEPSIDADGRDGLLEARGVAVPAGVQASTGSSSRRPGGATTGDGSGSGSGAGPSNGQRRRRRGSRGGRNRNRQRTTGGSGTGGGSGSGRTDGGSGSGSGSQQSSAD